MHVANGIPDKSMNLQRACERARCKQRLSCYAAVVRFLFEDDASRFVREEEEKNSAGDILTVENDYFTLIIVTRRAPRCAIGLFQRLIEVRS